jgi:AcrR family transcriptional regulator
MARWEPGANGRLQEAALELFLERGFEQTMVSDIAERAGVTARTFFRHFTDKREVLFQGMPALEQAAQAALEQAPATASALETVTAALDTVAAMIGGNREAVRRRQAVIMANAELQERELIKLVSLSEQLVAGLRSRGVAASEAGLVTGAAFAVYRVAFEQWLGADEDSELRDVVRASMRELKGLIAAG